MESVVGRTSRGGRPPRAGRIGGAAGPGGRLAASALAACAVPLLACPTPAHARVAGTAVPVVRAPMTRGPVGRGPASSTTAAHQLPAPPHQLPAPPREATASAPPAVTAGGAPVTPAPGSAATDDLYAVYCLAPDHRAQTAAAAVRLGRAAVPGRADRVAVGAGQHAEVLDVPAWAGARPAAFHRVCAAVVAAAQVAPAAGGGGGDGQGGGSDGLVRTALIAAIGAFLALLGQFVERGTARLRQRSDELRAALAGYAQQAETFLSDWGAGQPTAFGEVRSSRAALAALLRALPSHGARRAAAARLADELPLAEEPETTIEDGITGARNLTPQERAARATQSGASLTGPLGAVGELAGSSALWHLRHAVRAVGTRLPRRSSAGGAP